MIEKLQTRYEIECKPTEEKTRGSGFTDWQSAATNIGDVALASFINKMDPMYDTLRDINSHTAIAERLKDLGLPVQSYIALPVQEFLEQPDNYLAQIPNGDYYFASIKPGLHLAHTLNTDDIVRLASDYIAKESSTAAISEQIYISHNGEPTLSGHIIVDDGVEPNEISAEFTVGNFNTFHRGYSTPEISIRRSYHRFEWTFRGRLATEVDWRNDNQLFECNGGARLSRPEMAKRIFEALRCIPRDGDIYLPGYYEVLLENTDGFHTRPAFIEAILR